MDGEETKLRDFIENCKFQKIVFSSLKTESNLETVKNLPQDKILLETDCPWCEIRPSHAGFKFIDKVNTVASVKKEKWNAEAMIKSRNEPCNIRFFCLHLLKFILFICVIYSRQVLGVIAAVRNENPEELSEIVYKNTERLFFSANKIRNL